MKNTNDSGKLQKKIKTAIIGTAFLAAVLCFGMKIRKNDDSVILKAVAESEYESEENVTNKNMSNETESDDAENDFAGFPAKYDENLKASDETNYDSGKKSKENVSADETNIYVHVCGEVAAPGVYELSEGSRLYEAVEKAGGMTSEAAGEYVNLAQVVEDGQQVWIPGIEDIKKYQENGTDVSRIELMQNSRINIGSENKSSVTGSGDGSAALGGLVNLNTASRDELMTLNGIGASRADAILSYREEKGNFHKIEDIMKVPGIKNAAFQKIKDKITV